MEAGSELNVLITGGCGFIGVNLVNHLLLKGDFNIRVLDNLSIVGTDNIKAIASDYGKQVVEVNGTGRDRYGTDTIELLVGDVRDKDICIEACKEVDAVVHLAAHAGVVPSVEDPYFDFEVNILGTLNLLHASVKNKVDKFIFASSNAPLGDQAPPMDEDKVPAPLSPYGASKLACEGYCSAFYGSYGLKTVALRFSNAYGPFSLHKNSVIAKFLRDSLINREMTIYGDGSQTRDFIHVEDLCSAVYICLTSNNDQSTVASPINHTNLLNSKKPTSKIWGEVFHLGTGKGTPITELASYIRELFKNDVKIICEAERRGEIKMNYSDISKAQNIFGFEPHIDLKHGVREVYEWFISHGMDSVEGANVYHDSK